MKQTKQDKPVIVNLTLSEAKKTFAKLTPEDQHEFSHWAIEQAHIDEK